MREKINLHSIFYKMEYLNFLKSLKKAQYEGRSRKKFVWHVEDSSLADIQNCFRSYA